MFDSPYYIGFHFTRTSTISQSEQMLYLRPWLLQACFVCQIRTYLHNHVLVTAWKDKNNHDYDYTRKKYSPSGNNATDL